MFEYINYGALILSGLMFIIYLSLVLSDKKENSSLLNVLFAFMFVFIFIGAYYDYRTVELNTKRFTQGYVFKCHSGGGLYSSANSYKVSLADAWKVEKGYFTKEAFMVRIEDCEKW
jgi:hypothetical protein